MIDIVSCLNWLDRETSDFLQGATAMGSAVVSLIFLRFWRRRRDRLFLAFAIAFCIFAINRVALLLLEDDETRTYLYLLRLAAFLIIIWGIIDKNRSDSAPAGH